jgi:hypothetical protein
MAPRTIGELTRGMAHGGHIRHKNYEFISIEGLVLASAFSHSLDLCPRDLDPMAHDGHTLKIAPSGSIPKFTYIGGLVHPLSSPVMAKSSTQEARGPWLMADSPKEWPRPVTSF